MRTLTRRRPRLAWNRSWPRSEDASGRATLRASRRGPRGGALQTAGRDRGAGLRARGGRGERRGRRRAARGVRFPGPERALGAEEAGVTDGATKSQAMPKAYDAAAAEAGIYARWLAADVFAPDGAGSRADWSKPPFVIIQPPPNITGALHLGHAQRTTVEDAMTRHARMTGRPTLWLPGKDQASLAPHLR